MLIIKLANGKIFYLICLVIIVLTWYFSYSNFTSHYQNIQQLMSQINYFNKNAPIASLNKEIVDKAVNYLSHSPAAITVKVEATPFKVIQLQASP